MRSTHAAFRSGIALALILAGQQAVSQDWTALVLGNPSRNAPTAFADAFHASEAIKAAGLGPVLLRREIGIDAMVGAFDEVAGAPSVMIYFAGAIGPQTPGPVLMGQGGGDARLALGPVLERLAAAGTTQVAVLVEDCAGGSGMAGRMRLPEQMPAGLSVMIAASAGPDGQCDVGSPRLTERLGGASDAATLQDRLSGLWVGMDGLDSIAFAGGAPSPAAPTPTPAAPASVESTAPDPAPDAPTPAASDPSSSPLTGTPEPAPTASAPAETPVITSVTNDVIVLSAFVEPVAQTEVIGSVQPDRDEMSMIEDSTVIFVAPPASQLAALPLQVGLPEPSIIVGVIEGQESEFGTVPDGDPGDVASNEITFDNLEARRGLRAEDPELFETLVAGGAFDPPDVELARALQTELARMGCYRAGIDGIWGNGSRGSVDLYFAQIDDSPVNREPTVDLFRQIILKDDVACPAPQVAQPSAAASRPAATTTARPATPAPTTARPATPAPAPAPAPQPSGGGLSGSNLGGVFR